MHNKVPLYFTLLASLACTSVSILLLPRLSPSAETSNLHNLKPPHPQQQAPLNTMDPSPNSGPGPIVVGDGQSPDHNAATDDSDPNTLTISDILPKTRSINIFASLTRDISSLSQRLESTAPSANTTLLAPLNSAMQCLPRKPWEDRPGDETGVSATGNSDKAADNLRRFVESHVVPASPWVEGEEGKVRTLGGGEVWWERRAEERRVVMPGEVEVEGVVGRVGNGEIWALKGVVNYV